MKKILVLIAVIISTSATASAQSPVHFKHRQRNFTIVIPENHTDVQARAASELQHYLKIMFEAPFNIVTDNARHGKHCISIGPTKLAHDIEQRYGHAIRHDGFLLHSEKNCLYIIGHAEKSTLYGVYHFLENYFGCLMLTPEDIHLPETVNDTCLTIHDLQNPDFVYRETLQRFPNISQTYADWHKLQNRADMNRDWGFFVHSFRHLVPVEDYFEAHPEWFSEINGRRVRDGQLCLSNPEVLEILCRNLAKQMKAQPEKRIWSVSQNDNVNSCTCSRCRHLDSLYGGPSGTLLYFINQVARRFPDRTISTLAYQQTRRPPQNIRPYGNVNIMFCSIECQRQLPIAENPAEKSFLQDMKGWTALTDNIFLWDYVVQFRNFLDPFPNLHVLQPNLQLFHNNHIPMIFEQGSGSNVTENYEWRTFLLAHLLWNVNINVDSLRDRFFNAFYGEKRTPYIKQYLDTMAQTLIMSGQVLDIYGYPVHAKNGYLAPDMIRYYRSLFTEAENIAPVSGSLDSSRLRQYNDHLHLLKLPLDFAILELSACNLTSELSFFTYNRQGEKIIRQDMIDRVDKFVDDCHYFNVKSLEEMGYSPEEFRRNMQNLFHKTSKTNLATGKHVTCLTRWSDKYDVGGPKALTDGVFGVLDYHYNWLGFEGNHLDAIIDLDSVQDIHEISMDFYFYPLSWIFAPETVTCYVSNDQVHWQEVGTVDYQNEILLAKAKIVRMALENLSQRGRFVRVKAQSLLTNPSWHRGYGKPCWIFTDEIIIN